MAVTDNQLKQAIYDALSEYSSYWGYREDLQMEITENVVRFIRKLKPYEVER